MKKKLLVFAALLVLVLAVASVAFAKDVAEGAFVDKGELDQIANVGGHARNGAPWIVDKVETCTEPGLQHFVCTVDVGGTSPTTHNHYVNINPAGHKWSSTSGNKEWGKVEKLPTCMEPGYAIDVCTVCGATNDTRPDHVRDIFLSHEYDMTDDAYKNGHAVIEKEPHCGEGGEGIAWRTCIYGCGTKMPEQADKSHLVLVAKKPHNWSDWRLDEEPTCEAYGTASRTCINCGATQSVSEGKPVWDQGVQVTVDDVIIDGKYACKPLNPNYKELTGPYMSLALLEKDLSKAVYGLTKNWLKDCYTRELSYECPYCKLNGTKIHEPFTINLVKPATIAHEFVVAPDGNDDDHSLAPTCTKDGYYLYLCKYDKTGIAHGHDLTVKDDRWYKVVRPKLNHKFPEEWTIAQIYWQGKQAYAVSFRRCERCGATEQKTEKYDKPEVKQGLVKDEDGVYRYYKDGKVDTTYTNIVVYGTEKAEFWVVNGVVPPKASGLTICPDGKAYFLEQGRILRVTQWAMYGDEWFIIKNGELDPVTGLQPYNGGWFAVESGRKLNLEGLWQDPNTGVWTYMEKGQLVDYTGVTTYGGATFNVVHGYLVV
jgi:hypothetical protein